MKINFKIIASKSIKKNRHPQDFEIVKGKPSHVGGKAVAQLGPSTWSALCWAPRASNPSIPRRYDGRTSINN